MSLNMNHITRTTRHPSSQGLVRRMVNLPRSIVGGFSRVIGKFGSAKKDQTPQFQYQFQPNQEEFAFLSSFEQQFGSKHPCFYNCRFVEALKIAEDEHKFVFMYLHSPLHPFVPPFCRQTICNELVVQFLDANFVCWGALSDAGEGLQMAATFRPATFPCCAVIAPADANNILVLKQMEGPISPGELVEILQKTLEEQGSAFGNSRGKIEEKMKAKAREEEKIRADRRLREEQDAAYLAALKIDKETNEKEKNQPQQTQKPFQSTSSRHNSAEKQHSKATQVSSSGDTQTTMILIRFPNGERKEQRFLWTDEVQEIYKCIDSLGLPGIVNYRLVSSFPRRVFGVDQMGITLKEAGLNPKATLFLELM